MRFVLLVAVVWLSGCAAPIQATRDLPQPRSLDEVNALLEGKRVTIERVDGEPIEWARGATVTESEVSFTVPAPGPAPGRIAVSIPIGDVSRITYVRNRGARVGAAVGAAPGVYSIAVGAGLLVGGGNGPTQLAGLAIFLISVPQTLAGAALGGWVGQAASPGGVVPLYQAPIERYLAPPALPLPDPADQ